MGCMVVYVSWFWVLCLRFWGGSCVLVKVGCVLDFSFGFVISCVCKFWIGGGGIMCVLGLMFGVFCLGLRFYGGFGFVLVGLLLWVIVGCLLDVTFQLSMKG